MRIVFLGTGGTYPSRYRNVLSIAVQLPGEVVMLDCGEGTQRQLMRSSVSFMKIMRIFLSHLHADHFLGLPGLVQSMSLNGREAKLTVYGPRGTAENVETMLNLGYFKSAFEVESVDLRPGRRLDFGEYTVVCAKGEHTVPSLAYALEEKMRPGRFDVSRAKSLGIPEGPLYRRLQRGKPVVVEGRTVTPSMVLGPPRPGRKIVYSGDTRPSDRIVALAKGADVLIHEATLHSEYAELAAAFGHSTAAEAATVAKKAGVRALYLVHLSPRYDDPAVIEKEAKAIFPASEVVEDLSERVVRLPD